MQQQCQAEVTSKQDFIHHELAPAISFPKRSPRVLDCDRRLDGDRRLDCDRRLEYSRGQDEGQCEKSWEQLRNSRRFIKETTEKWQDLAETEERRLEREGRKMGQEILKKRKEKFGKVGGKKLTVLEEVILRNQTRKKTELAEVEQNVKREQNRRQGKRMEKLEPEDTPEGRKRQEVDEHDDRATELDEEGHWRNMITHRVLILENQEWMSARRLEASSLEEQRMLAYGKKPEVSLGDVWKFWEVKAGSQANCDDIERVHSYTDAMKTKIQEGWTRTSQVEGKSSLQKTAEDNTLLQKTTEDILPTDRLHVIPTLSLVKSKEDSSMFKFKFGRKEASEMHMKDPEVGVKEQTPRKIQRRLEEMRAKPVLMKDAARSTRSDNLSQERSPGLGGRVMMKKTRCTPQKIRKISQVSTLKHLFENATASSLTRGPLELLLQSTQGFNLIPGARATTTRDAMYSRKDCVSQSDTPIRTGPRQTAFLGLSLSQDWTSQTCVRDKDQ